MRGFRGSRAAQNTVSARHGQGHAYSQFKSGIPYYPNQQDKLAQRPPLPDWLKTPETRAKEQLEAYGQTGKRAQVTPAQAHAAAQAKAPLRVVSSQPIAQAKPAAGRQQPQLQMIKGGTTATAKPAASATKAKTAVKKTAAAKPAVAAKKKAASGTKTVATKAKPRTAAGKVARKATTTKRKAA